MRRPSLVSPTSTSPPAPLKLDLPTAVMTATGLETPSDTAIDSPALRTPFTLPATSSDVDSPADLLLGARRRCSEGQDTKLPRFSLAQSFTPITYPYTSGALGARLRSTLRPRRRSSFYRLAQKKFLHIAFTLAVPLLFLCILQEHATHRHRAALGRRADIATVPRMLHVGAAVDLGQMREEYERKRRRDIVVARTPPGYARRSLMLLERNRDGDQAGSMGGVDWTLEEEAQLKHEVQDMWPEWWGSADVVGRGPFDHVPNLEGKRRILFLTDYKDYLERMNTHTYEIVDAALRHANAIVDVWGPGWKNYDKGVPLSVNLKRRQRRIQQIERSKAEYEAEKVRRLRKGWYARTEQAEMEPWMQPEWEDIDGETTDSGEGDECGDVRFDIVWTISDIYKQNDPHVDALDCGSLLVQQLGDCHSFRCMKEWYPQANNITLSKYAFELPEIFDHGAVKDKFPAWSMGLFGHSPDTANEWDFWPVRWSEKKSTATMFGYDGSFYPIRTSVSNKERHDKSAMIGRHGHPGYTVGVPDEAKQHPLETYAKGHELYAKHESLREDFARGMREAKICVFDASLERKLIRKYAQALLSGCVIAGDLPTEHEEDLERFVIKLKPSWSIERIEEEIQKFLDQPDKLHQMALDGMIYARQHLTTTKKVTDVIRMADAHRAGARGYDFPFSFSLRCRAYWSNRDAYRPPWCSTEGGYRGLEG